MLELQPFFCTRTKQTELLTSIHSCLKNAGSLHISLVSTVDVTIAPCTIPWLPKMIIFLEIWWDPTLNQLETTVQPCRKVLINQRFGCTIFFIQLPNTTKDNMSSIVLALNLIMLPLQKGLGTLKILALYTLQVNSFYSSVGVQDQQVFTEYQRY